MLVEVGKFQMLDGGTNLDTEQEREQEQEQEKEVRVLTLTPPLTYLQPQP